MKTTAGPNTPPPTCPVCGAPMQPYGRGAARSQYKARWICPVARQEEFTDEKGRIKRSPDAWLLGVLYSLHAAEDSQASDVYTKETHLPVQAPPTPAGITVVNIVVNQKR